MGIMDRIQDAYKWAFTNRPKVNGYPYLAEALRQAGVNRYVYNLPSCQCIYFTNDEQIASQTDTVVSGMNAVPKFNKDAFIKILRTSQNGEITFPEFLKGSWDAGVISYEADLILRKVTYHGSQGESYIEDYPQVEVKR